MTHLPFHATPASINQASLASKPVVDGGMRMIHAGMALAFVASYLTAEMDRWRVVHVVSGYSVLALLSVRLLWGWLGPATSGWALLRRRLAMWDIGIQKCKEGNWRPHHFWLGICPWMLGVVVLCLYGFSGLAAVSGWATYNEWLGKGIGSEMLETLHEVLAQLALMAVWMHLGLVLTLRVTRGVQAVRPMWRGYANTSD